MGKLTKIYLIDSERLKNLSLEWLVKGFVKEHDFRFLFGIQMEDYGSVRYYQGRNLFSISVSKEAVDNLTNLAIEGILQHEIIQGLAASIGVKEHGIYRKDEAEIDNIVTKVYDNMDPMIAYRCETIRMKGNEKSKKHFLEYISYLSVLNSELSKKIEKKVEDLFDFK